MKNSKKSVAIAAQKPTPSQYVVWVVMAVLALAVIILSINLLNPATASENPSPESGVTTTRVEPAPFEVNISQNGLVVTAEATTAEAVTWKRRFVQVGEFCNPAVFAVSPNYPSVGRSNVYTVPQSHQSIYRDRWICFEASDTAGRTAYGVFSIDLGRPVITVLNQTEGETHYMQAISDDDATLRIFETNSIMAGSVGDYPLVGSICERAMAGVITRVASSPLIFEEVEHSSGRFPTSLVAGLGFGSYHCFVAEDSEGNRAYLGAWATDLDTLVFYKSSEDRYNRSARRLYDTTGAVAWRVAGPLDSDTCDATVVASNASESGFEINEYYSVSLDVNADDHGKYYCFEAEEHFGNKSYRSLQVDLQPPTVTFASADAGQTAIIKVDEPVFNSRLVGPLLERSGTDLSEDCAAVFTRDEHGRYPDAWWTGQYRPSEIHLDWQNNHGKYFCLEASDRWGNTAIYYYDVTLKLNL